MKANIVKEEFEKGTTVEVRIHLASGWTEWRELTEHDVIYDSTDYEYREIDEYTELRRALDAGKELEYNSKYNYPQLGEWGKFSGKFNAPAEYYRIKPEFKVGDYVKYTGDKPNKTYIAMINSFDLFNKWEGFKPWVLEEADDDEWVYVHYGSGLSELCNVKEAKKTKLKYHANQMEQKIIWVKPFCNQTPERLGLGK